MFQTARPIPGVEANSAKAHEAELARFVEQAAHQQHAERQDQEHAEQERGADQQAGARRSLAVRPSPSRGSDTASRVMPARVFGRDADAQGGPGSDRSSRQVKLLENCGSGRSAMTSE